MRCAAQMMSRSSNLRNEKSLGRQGRVSAEARVRLGGLSGARPRRWPSHLGRQGRVSAEAPRYAVPGTGIVTRYCNETTSVVNAARRRGRVAPLAP